MDDDKLKQLWGQELFDYAYQKSIDLIGYPDYPIMVMAAIGKIKDKVNLGLGGAVSGALGG